jgi:hypothetical protein
VSAGILYITIGLGCFWLDSEREKTFLLKSFEAAGKTLQSVNLRRPVDAEKSQRNFFWR